ncbi:hypothetical protein T492DRAFT_861386 [Pavlovales sp. CCMP2436]|nr:hypothetical protein T492DRAFT_861386 [Pavlovales sp. CCMP2436]
MLSPMAAVEPAAASSDDLLVEKIFAVRTDKATGEQMLHVKWKDRAHIHSSWVPTSLLESQPANKSRLQRYVRQREQERAEGEPDEEFEGEELPYNAEWTVVERVIAERPSQANDKSGVEYLVKWCMLPYSACTWEHPSEIEISRNRLSHFHKVG